MGVQRCTELTCTNRPRAYPSGGLVLGQGIGFQCKVFGFEGMSFLYKKRKSYRRIAFILFNLLTLLSLYAIIALVVYAER